MSDTIRNEGTRKGTPGPWGIASSSDGYEEYWIEAKGWGRIIRCEDESNESEANAALIASAPALLEALRHAVEWEAGEDLPEPPWVEDARAALALASGKGE